MNYSKLQQLKEKFYFTVEDVAYILNIKSESAKVLCSRYTRKGIFIRLKKNFYILEQCWKSFSNYDFLMVSNLLQIPSYISFMTALSHYEITTQVQKNYFENVSLRRTKNFNIDGITFNYYKLKKEYYFDFIKNEDIFIAIKEKAFIDSIYLYSFGKYKLDLNSLDLSKLDKKKIRDILKVYPPKTKKITEELCKI